MVELKPGFLAVADNNIVQIWNLSKTSAYQKEIIHHEDHIVAFKSVDNGEFVFSVGRDKSIIYWNTLDAEPIFIKDT